MYVCLPAQLQILNLNNILLSSRKKNITVFLSFCNIFLVDDYSYDHLSAVDDIFYARCPCTDTGGFLVIFILSFLKIYYLWYKYLSIKMCVLPCTTLGNNVQKKAPETWDRHSPSKHAKIVQTTFQDVRKTRTKPWS